MSDTKKVFSSLRKIVSDLSGLSENKRSSFNSLRCNSLKSLREISKESLAFLIVAPLAINSTVCNFVLSV